MVATNTGPPRPDVDPPVVIRDDATADRTLNTFLALGSVYAELCRSPEFGGEVLHVARGKKDADDVGGAVDEDKDGAEGDTFVADDREEKDEATSDDDYDYDDDDSISWDDSTVPPPPPPYPTETESVTSLPPPPPPPPPSRQTTSKVEVRDISQSKDEEKVVDDEATEQIEPDGDSESEGAYNLHTPKEEEEEEEEEDEPSTPKDQTLYDLLQVNRNTCTKADIKRAHRNAAMKYHPDRLSGNDISLYKSEQDHAETFTQIQHAYEILSDEVRKMGYDAELRLAELREEEEKAK